MNRRELAIALAGFGVLPQQLFAQAPTTSGTQGTAHSLPSARLLALRTWPAPDALRLTLEYKGVASVESFLLEDGAPRLVVDVYGLAWNAESQAQLNQSIAKNDMVERVRAAVQASSNAVRLVIEDRKSVV